MNEVGPTPRALLNLARARVHARLERGIEFPLLVVSAPRGFGKTTVLREFLMTTNRPYRYLPVTSAHGDLLGFMRAFADALGDVVPALQTSFMGVYDRMHQAADAPAGIAAWAVGHLEPIEGTLLLDDLENISDERVVGLLTELVDRTAHTKIRWILVSQSADRFPIARWLAADRMDLPIEDDDLALTAQDLGAALERAQSPFAPDELRDVCLRVGDWPAALALALNENGAPPTRESDPDGVALPYASFAQRAYGALCERDQRFLLETCVYKHFDLGVLTAAGWENTESLLARLCDAGAFLFCEGPGAYRYHALFQAFLEDLLRAGPTQKYQRIRSAAADVSRGVGRWVDALELYTDLGAAAPLAELLSEHGFALVDRGEATLVYRSLRVLGDAEFEAFPVALAVKASLESLHGSFDLAEAWFRHAVKNADDPGQRSAIVFRFATDLVRQDRRDAIDVLEPIVGAGGHDLGLSVSLAGLLATSYATHHQGDRAASTIQGALAHMSDVEDPAIRAKVYFQAGYVAFFARDFGRANQYAQQAVEAALASHLYDIAARALSILYNIAIDVQDDVRAGQRYLEQLASCSIKAGSRQLLLYAKFGQFEIEVLRGNLLESARLDEALALLEVDYSVLASETLLPAQALRAAWTGDFARAYGLLATTAEQQITPSRAAQRQAEIAVYAAAAGSLLEANNAVRAALALTMKTQIVDRAGAFTAAHIALALVLLGRHRYAARVLSDLGQSAGLTPRLEVFRRAIATLNDRWLRGRYSGDLRETLRELDAVDFGGIGRLIEALPLPATVRARVTRSAGMYADRAHAG